MSINLLRNSKVYFTTNIKTTDPDRGRILEGTGADPDHTTSTTFEIQVLDDLTFSQTTAVETISVNETGTTPIRGQRTFNTALNPVDFSFTTYMRPNAPTGTTVVTCEESVLWNAMFGLDAIGGLNPAWADGNTTGPTPASCVLTNSAKHQLQRFGLIVIFDNNAFLLDDCSLNTATIDFGIDAIASIQWSGQARRVRRVAAPTNTAGVWSGSLTVTYKPKVTTAPFIANKLTTVTLKSKIGTASSVASGTFTAGTAPSTGSTSYTMPLTGGSITLTNNITYLTPAYMGTINEPIAYFTGSRSVTGSLTAYLRTGTGYSSELFQNLVNNIAVDSDPEFYLQVEIGGSTSQTKVELEMPGVVLTIPTINAESVITTTVNFTAQGSANNAFDILQNNEIVLKYHTS
jgi:hypothetical protein